MPDRRKADTKAGQHRFADAFRIARAHPAGDLDTDGSLGAGKMPAHAGGYPGKREAIMRGKIARPLRQGLAAQIGRCCDHDAPGHADFSRDQRIVADLAAANGKIDAFLDQVGVGVVHHKIDADVGIARQKFL